MTEQLKQEEQTGLEELDTKLFDLSSLEPASKYLKTAVKALNGKSPKEVTKIVLSHLTADGKQRLLEDLVADKVLKEDKKASPTEEMDERNPDTSPSAYPYIHGYSGCSAETYAGTARSMVFPTLFVSTAFSGRTRFL